MHQPSFPDIVVDLIGQQNAPVACIAVVRRALQKAGQTEAAQQFTDQAFASPTEQILDLARRYVQLVV